MDIEKELNDWMNDHQTDYFDLLRETAEEFEAAHPGVDQTLLRMNTLSMADRRFMARALGVVLPKYLGQAGK